MRAYSLLSIKSLDEDSRIIEGIASTPTPDRGGDVMEPGGAQFTLPMPFLWFHDDTRPIGEVFDAKVVPEGIFIRARVSRVDEPGPLKTRIDEAWQSLKANPPLVRGLSIGWKELQGENIPGTKFRRILKWIWAELSAVTVPMNTEATILSVKHADLAASGPAPGVTGSHPVVRARKDAQPMTIQEQVTQWTNTRAPKQARMNELMSKAAESGVTLDEQQAEEYDGLDREIKSIDVHLTRLQAHNEGMVASAVPVTGVTNATTAAAVRGGMSVISVKSALPKGTAFTRFIMAKVIGKNSMSDAIAYAESRKDWADSTPEVALALKAAVNPGTIAEPAWAAPLAVARPMQDEFLELLRPATIIGKIPGLRRVPFNISMPVQTGGGTYGWVGEGAPKPVGNLQFTSATLGVAKAAGIIVISEELAKVSSPSAEAVVRNDMIAGMAAYLDQQFIDPTVAAVTNVSPASITNAAVSIGSAGTSADNARTDIKALIASLLSANQGNASIANAVLIMSEGNAFALSVALNPLGQPLYPGLSASGGMILGIPVITSQAAGTTVALVLPNEILFADDGGVNIDVSREASVEMSTTPTSPSTASVVLVSLWQQNLIGLRAERFINWKRARLSAVRYTTVAGYV